MPKLSDMQKKFLAEATTRYKESLPGSEAAEYLVSRGLDPEDPEIAKFRLGFVEDPLPGHDMYRKMLAIPYMRWSPGSGWSVVSMRFRCVSSGCEHQTHGKYMSHPGDSPRMFNALALLDSEDVIAICEGEIDAITSSFNGLPAVGIAGVESWKAHFKEPFLGYEVVYILADGDDPGMKFASKLAKAMPNTKILPMGPGEDVNSEYLKKGSKFLEERIA